MEITIGNSTFYLERVLFVFFMQTAWTLVLSISGILSTKKKDILILGAITALPFPILLALYRDWTGVLIFVLGAAAGCGIALYNRRSVGATFVLTTLGSIGVLMAGSAILASRTGQMGACVMVILLSALTPALAMNSQFRRRLNGELP